MHPSGVTGSHFIRRLLSAASVVAALAALPCPGRASAPLTVQTLGSVEVSLPKGAKLPLSLQVTQDGLALTMATKAAIVAAIFMELREGRRLTIGFAVAGILWLGIMLWLASMDFLSRSQGTLLR